MTNLKRVLSLALAAVMLMGMMVMGASAETTLDAYPDADTITPAYEEAIDLLTALDVLEGDAGGFRPGDTLTRAEAAKIVAYVALGVDAAERLTVSSDPFVDVKASNWAAGYIAYCANVGIINGIGNNKFDPQGKVTGYQMAKMLLCVLGYGANKEYVGSNWALNVVVDGQTVGMFNRLDEAVSNDPCTREEAAQLAFNTLNLNMVAYSSLFGTYVSTAINPGTGKTELLGTKADKIFNVTTVPTVDDYGYNYRYWRYQDRAAAITGEYLTDNILGTVTGGTKGNLYRSYVFEDRYCIIENGQIQTRENAEGQNVVDWLDSEAELRNSREDLIEYNGQVVTVVDTDNDGEADCLNIVTSYLAEVTRVNAETASSERSVVARVYVPSDNAAVSTVTATIPTEDYAVGDYILVDPSMTLADVSANNTPLASLTAAFSDPCGTSAAQSVTGSVSAFYLNEGDAEGSVTTGGIRYAYNGVFDDSAALGYVYTINPGYTLSSATYSFYLDKAGNVIGVKVVEDSISDYVYVVRVGENQFELSNVVMTVDNEGNFNTYNVSSKSSEGLFDTTDRNTNANDGLRAGTEGEGHIYSYSIDTNGEIILTKLATPYSEFVNVNDVSFTKGKTTLTFTAGTGDKVVYANDATVFLYVDTTKGTATVYVGRNNAPTMNDVDNVSIATQGVRGTTYANLVVIEGDIAPSYNNFAYIIAARGNSYDATLGRIYYYDAILDGELVRLAATNSDLDQEDIRAYTVNDAYTGDAANGVSAGLYTFDVEDVDTVVRGIVAVAPVTNAIVVKGVGNDEGTEYILSEGANVTDISVVNPLTEIVLDASVEPGDPVTMVTSRDGVTAIFITGVNVAYIDEFTYDASATAAGTIDAVTTAVKQNEGAALAYNVFANDSLTVDQLVAAIRHIQ